MKIIENEQKKEQVELHVGDVFSIVDKDTSKIHYRFIVSDFSRIIVYGLSTGTRVTSFDSLEELNVFYCDFEIKRIDEVEIKKTTEVY